MLGQHGRLGVQKIALSDSEVIEEPGHFALDERLGHHSLSTHQRSHFFLDFRRVAVFACRPQTVVVFQRLRKVLGRSGGQTGSVSSGRVSKRENADKKKKSHLIDFLEIVRETRAVLEA